MYVLLGCLVHFIMIFVTSLNMLLPPLECAVNDDFDKLSNNQKTFSIFCSFPLSYSYRYTICCATVHTELALFSLKNSLFRDL